MELEHTGAWTLRLSPLLQHTYYLPTEYNIFNRLLDGGGGGMTVDLQDDLSTPQAHF